MVTEPARGRRSTPGVRVQSPSWRARRIAALTAGLLLLPAAVSYVVMLTQTSDSSLGVRTVEWLRDNGARGLVNRIENIYYSWTAPSKGGPALRALPRQAGAAATPSELARRAAAHHAAPPYLPRPIKTVIHPALAGEGVWHATEGGFGTDPPVLITSFRPQADYPQIVAGVAWINHARTTTWLYPGIQEPAVSLPDRGPEEVPTAMRSRLVATFNSGFKLADSGGGFAEGGHTYASMKRGLATIVRYTDGRVDVIPWSGGPDVGPGVVYARQNLPLIVNGGKPNPNLSTGPQWGATLGNAIQVWRSAVGVDRYGNLLYAAADYQTVGSLAHIMIRAGAVRAMEMDINTYWDSLITYRHPGGVGPANLLPSMVRSPYRYLTPDDRDFFAVYVR
ncbi:MAG TPA: phosphodiester glycosidase family protein [Solirubrobacteraceae bacterium]|nr:phosphodiester glycosidase family protein [Solirubrobacteraceae bacterium]